MAPLEPLHTRTLSIRLGREDVGALHVEARVLDLRKRGVVSLGGVVNGPGVVHDMTAQLVLDDELRIRAASLSMPSVPFPARRETAGESCRDNESGFDRVVGLRLGNGFLTGVQRTIGGPRGCFHVFTVMRLLGPTVTWAVGLGLARDAGRAFARMITVDGAWDGTALHLHGGVNDLHYGGVGAEEIDRVLDAEADVAVTVPDLVVRRAAARYTGTRGTSGLEPVGDLAGSSLLRGYGLRLDEVLPARGAHAPVRQLLLMLQPVAFQCMPSLVDAGGSGTARRGGPLAARDSCSMWRQDGPLIAEVGRRDAAAH